MQAFAVKGNLIYSKNFSELIIREGEYLICEGGVVKGIYKELPDEYQGISITDYGDNLIVPGFTDLHLHAPQYAFSGMGMDLELLDWLNTHTFPEESKYADLEYAAHAYKIFTEDLKNSVTTRACIFATLHVPATNLLMDLLEKTGIKAYVGKVNMDRNSPDNLREESAEKAAQDTIEWIKKSQNAYQNIKPILTPRFTPSCTDELMKLLGDIQKQTEIPVQSHLSENYGEIEWVKELCPWTSCYGEAYHKFGLFGGNVKTVMAHCVHSTEEEIALIKEKNVYIAHCPTSNTNLSSGIAPIRTYLEQEISMGLGSDIAGGHSLSMLEVTAHAIQVSKLRWRLVDETKKPLTVAEAFCLATKAGGSFFGNVGSFESGYEFDAVILSDQKLCTPQKLTVRDRLERLIYHSGECDLKAKYISGNKVI